MYANLRVLIGSEVVHAWKVQMTERGVEIFTDRSDGEGCIVEGPIRLVEPWKYTVIVTADF